MILILFSWIYILFCTINFGVTLCKFLKIETKEISVLSFLGLFTTTLLATIWAIFGRINIEFNIFLLLINLVIFYFLKKEIISIYKELLFKIASLSLFLKFYLLFNFLLILAQSASPSFFIDNESYYIQTIKWLNEYGLVNGLGNLHIFLAQTSGWHIAQSAFNFSFIYKNFNDLSGFALLLGLFYSCFKLDEYFKNNSIIHLVLGLFSIANIVFFNFISSPSPDMPIYVLTFLIFGTFLLQTEESETNDFAVTTLLILFVAFIKLSTFVLCLIPLVVFLNNPKKYRSKLIPLFVFSFVVLCLFIVKNSIISGYPLYPIATISIDVIHRIPKNIVDYFYNETKSGSFHISYLDYKSLSHLALFEKWIFGSLTNLLFNSLSVFVIAFTPFLINKYNNTKKMWLLYLVSLTQFILLFFSIPMFRFFLGYSFFFLFFCMSLVLSKRIRFINPLLIVSTTVCFVMVFIPINLKGFTKNKYMEEIKGFSINNLITPHKSSKYNIVYKKFTKGNLTYYSPTNTDFYWLTGDSKLPCINKRIIDYFETEENIYPQMMGKNLGNGFYSKEISKNE